MLDQVIHLMSQTETYRDWTVDQVSRCIIPAVNLNQCTGIVEDGYLVAWVSWAFMDEENGDKFLDGNYTMQPESWSSGDRLVMMDFIAPFQHTPQLVKIVRQLFPDYPKAEWRRHIKQKRVGVKL
jgi:cytolysin-activating lysine-acyltransferase